MNTSIKVSIWVVLQILLHCRQTVYTSTCQSWVMSTGEYASCEILLEFTNYYSYHNLLINFYIK